MRSDIKKLEEGPVKELIQKCWSESAEERPTFDEIIHCYTENRKYFWPEDVDDEEVEQYLNKFGLSLDQDKIVEFFLKNPSIDEEEEENNNNDDDDNNNHKKKKDKSKDKDDLYDTPISQITSISELKALLLEKIESMDYMSEDCIDSDINEDDIIMKLNKPYSQYYQRALDDNDPVCLFYIANSYHKGRDPFPQDKHYAIKYMKKAASFGLQNAIYGLAYLILPNFNGDDCDKVENFINTLQIAVVFGSEKASYIFGFLYSIGIKEDEEEEEYFEENELLNYINKKDIPSRLNDEFARLLDGNEITISKENSSYCRKLGERMGITGLVDVANVVESFSTQYERLLKLSEIQQMLMAIKSSNYKSLVNDFLSKIENYDNKTICWIILSVSICKPLENDSLARFCNLLLQRKKDDFKKEFKKTIQRSFILPEPNFFFLKKIHDYCKLFSHDEIKYLLQIKRDDAQSIIFFYKEFPELFIDKNNLAKLQKEQENFDEFIETGLNTNSFLKIIRNDDINSFQQIVINKKINLNQEIKKKFT